MSVAYHTFYLDYFEEARTEALRELGLPYKDLEASGVIMPVVRASVQYRASAYYDDILEIETTFEEIPRARVPISYIVRRQGDENHLVATGEVTLCFVDAARGKPIRAPRHVCEIFEGAWPEKL